jgi:ABC-2 type transport system ATP-binding protein
VRTKLRALPNVLNVEPGPGAPDGRSRLFVDCAVGSDVRADLAAAVVKGGWALYQLRNVGMSLEEVFLQLTTQEAPADLTDDETAEEPAEAVAGR